MREHDSPIIQDAVIERRDSSTLSRIESNTSRIVSLLASFLSKSGSSRSGNYRDSAGRFAATGSAHPASSSVLQVQSRIKSSGQKRIPTASGGYGPPITTGTATTRVSTANAPSLSQKQVTPSAGQVVASTNALAARQEAQTEKGNSSLLSGFKGLFKHGMGAVGNRALAVGGNDTLRESAGSATAGPIWSAAKELHTIAKDVKSKAGDRSTTTGKAWGWGKDRLGIGRAAPRTRGTRDAAGRFVRGGGSQAGGGGSSSMGGGILKSGLSALGGLSGGGALMGAATVAAFGAAAFGVQQFTKALNTGESDVNNWFKKLTGLDAGKTTQGDVDSGNKKNVANTERINAERVAAGKAPLKYDPLTGNVASQFEAGAGKTAAQAAATISSGKGDNGGKSYGSFQLASNKGEVDKFVKQSGYGDQFKGLKVGTEEFDKKWKETAANDPKFADAQKDYAVKTKFDPQMAKLQENGVDLSGRGKAVNEMVLSTANQYGANTGKIQSALNGKDTKSMSDAEIVSSVQDYKAAHVSENFKSSSPEVQAGVAKRIQAEKKSLLAMDASAGPKAPLKDPAAQVPAAASADGPTKQAAATSGPANSENSKSDSKKIGMQFDNALLTLQAYDRV